MNTDLLTSPFFIWYGVVLILLYLAGSGLGKLADQKQKRQASQSRRTRNMTQLDIDASTASPMRRRGTSVVVVRADWRSDRSVWVSSSRELPHLSAEAQTLEELATQLQTLCSGTALADDSEKSAGTCPDAIELVACRILTFPVQS